jgi:GNAT superfamily N-acetyltransferase
VSLTIRPVRAGDRDGWNALYAGYAAFYGVEQTPAMRDCVWSWLTAPAGPLQGLVAERDGLLVGLAHLRPFARPLSASQGLYLDDLFVAPDARGAGVARALVSAATARARASGYSVLRWITAADNHPARALYEQVADRTPWVTYDIRP